jgi:hypothetical protein
MYIEK